MLISRSPFIYLQLVQKNSQDRAIKSISTFKRSKMLEEGFKDVSEESGIKRGNSDD